MSQIKSEVNMYVYRMYGAKTARKKARNIPLASISDIAHCFGSQPVSIYALKMYTF